MLNSINNIYCSASDIFYRLHLTVHTGCSHCADSTHPTCFYANQQCHVKRDRKLTKINDSCTQMSIKTSDCSLLIGWPQLFWSKLNVHICMVKKWMYNTEFRTGPDSVCVCVCWSQILACQQFDWRAVSFDWIASSSSVPLQSSRLKLRFKFGLWFVMKFARPLPLVVLFRAVAVTGRNQSQLKIVCSLASWLASRFSEEILQKSSSWWRRHDLRASLFVCIRALKF